jgi:ribosomal protein S18 acetylase RimI-like enzyme
MAMASPFQFRAASASDVESLIDLMMVSSWGGIRAAWERVRSPRETWRQRGAAEIADVGCEIGYSRFVVAERESRIAGMILLNFLGDTSMLDPEAEPPEQQGVLSLIKAAEFSVFVREIAVLDWARGRGLATAFLSLADSIAESRGDPRVTLIVNDQNTAAHRLYGARGFRPVASTPSIGHPAFSDASSLLLMEKRIQPAA